MLNERTLAACIIASGVASKTVNRDPSAIAAESLAIADAIIDKTGPTKVPIPSEIPKRDASIRFDE